ncbi:Uu.00g048890.m01.CDS01 [Anthostomella pinea]|uniref:Uu.00g048890.m01.CDS01 n=1 Tax=Anthostomella pinea TaxID=933095 RepID=A0AAI8YEM9_9PEZI|nr:Uu.00g048890.m01.CDS01 [Anthostomella pinea]
MQTGSEIGSAGVVEQAREDGHMPRSRGYCSAFRAPDALSSAYSVQLKVAFAGNVGTRGRHGGVVGDQHLAAAVPLVGLGRL